MRVAIVGLTDPIHPAPVQEESKRVEVEKRARLHQKMQSTARDNAATIASKEAQYRSTRPHSFTRAGGAAERPQKLNRQLNVVVG